MKIRDGWYVWYSKADKPNLYKISNDHTKLVNFFIAEYEKYIPGDDVTNWYSDLLEEVKNAGARFD